MIYFTADTHFGHTNILKYEREDYGFDSVESHDAELVRRWNSVVGKQDDVYHLGDFSLTNTAKTVAILKQLNGRIHLVKGNHDRVRGEARNHFVWVKDYYNLKVDGTYIVMFHYAIERWDRAHHGSWHLHGHSHGHCPSSETQLRLDVGSDAHDLTPISLEQVKAHMARKVRHD